MKKRFWALFLAVMMVVSVLPMSAFATEADPLSPAPNGDEYVTVGKTAERTGADTWKITLTIETEEIAIQPEPMDLVILMDTSYSMRSDISGNYYSNNTCRMEIAGPAAQELVANLATAGVNARVAVVTFDKSSDTKIGMTQLTNENLDDINNAIPDEKNEAADFANVGTNMTAGLKAASAVLDKSEVENKVIVMLGDGEPYDDDDDPPETYGDGPSAETIQNYLIDKGITVHTIGFSVDSAVLFNIADKTGGNYYTTSSSDGLTAIFTDIKNELVAMVSDDMRSSTDSDVAIQDILVVPNGSSVSVSPDGKLMNWNPADGVLGSKETAIITYTVKLDDVDNFEPGRPTVYLNGDAVLSYQAGEQTGTVKFPIPSDEIEVAQLVTEIYLDGELHSSEPGEKLIVYTNNETFTWDEPNDTIKVGDKEYQYVRSMYGTEPTEEFSGKAIVGTNTVAHYYVSEPDVYNVTYAYIGEVPEGAPEAPAEATYAVDTEVTVKDVPTLEGYTFSGWSTTDATVEGNKFNMPAKAVAFTGSWSKNSYKVTYEYTGEVPEDAPEAPAVAAYKYGESVTVADKPALEGYTFSGWSKTGTFNMPAEDVTITGSWSKNSYKVTYEYTGEVPEDAPETPAVAAYKYGESVTVADKPALEGYTFSGWSTTDATVEGNKFNMPAKAVAFTGSWSKNSYKVTYYVDGVQVGEAETYQFGAEVTVKDEPTQAGYDFFGWSYDPEVEFNEEGKFTMPAANVTISGYFLQHCTVEASKDVYQLLDAEGKQFWPVELEGDAELPRSTIETVAIPAVKAGETIIWKITVVNVGDQPGEFMLNELLAGVQVFADEACTEPVDLTQPFAIGAQGNNEATEYSVDFFAKYTVQEKDVAEIINKITVSGSEEPIVAPGVDVANIAVTKTADKTDVKVGDKVTYTIIVKNEGTVDLADVKVTDTFVAGGKGTLTVKSGNLEVGKLAAGETATIVLEYTTVTSDVNGLKNTAVAEGSYDGEKTVGESDTEEVKVTKKNEPVRPVGPSKPALNKADHYAYIVGYPDGLVHPEKNITRAEVSTIFFRMLLDESREDFWAQENWFSDVPAHMWYNNAVSTLANAGLITGYPDGSFKPNANITRAEFATIAIRFFLEEDVEITENNLSDVKGHWAEANINLAYALNLINGYPDGTFRPDQKITRAEAMTIVNRVLERAPEKDHLLDDMIEWPDNMNKDAWYYAAVQEATNSHEFYRDSKNEYEVWTELLPVRDWAALEREWSQANSSKNPGEVVDINVSTPEAGN